MPKPGYYSLTIRQETADQLLKMATEKNMSLVEFFEDLAQNLNKYMLLYSFKTETLKQDLANAYMIFKRIIDLDRFLRNPMTMMEILFGSVEKEERYSIRFLPWEDSIKIHDLAVQIDPEAQKIQRILNVRFPDWRNTVKIKSISRPLTPRERRLSLVEFGYILETYFGINASWILEVIDRLRPLKESIPELDQTIGALEKAHKVLFELIKKYKNTE
ncbi:MAG: hypothetical protein QXS54_07525 [Candidatus Methanomethylicaceae archaeon]